MGQAAGGVERTDGTSQALHLDIETGDYTSLAGGVNSGADDVNNLNQIVGNSDGIAAFWSHPHAAPIALPPLPGHITSGATRINDGGIVIGGSDDDLFNPATPVVWRVVVDADGVASVDGPLALPTLPGGGVSWGAEITEVAGNVALVAGYSFDGTTTQAVIWTIELDADGMLIPPQPPTLVGALGLSSEASAINNVGEVSGTSDGLPFVAQIGAAPAALPVPRNTLDANALDLNDDGTCVGYVQIQFKGSNVLDGPLYAYLWKDGEAIDLAKQIPKQSGWEYLTWAGSINNAGLISGFGRFDVSRRGFIMIPSEP